MNTRATNLTRGPRPNAITWRVRGELCELADVADDFPSALIQANMRARETRSVHRVVMNRTNRKWSVWKTMRRIR